MHILLNSSCGLFGDADLSSWVSGVNGDGRVVLLLSVLGAVIAIVAIVATYADKIHRRNAELQIKRDMLERGLSVDEIERVLAAKATNVK
jgi:hypothetical protein